ncbi:MFS transporter [Sutterella sp.]|uniref:uridine transporter UriT n=1 Tax=Sutterella sp. TaxID=1981025 RepID=UPI0026E0A4FE|nr:MFS transporter [Sutterella sp.]MDO5531823.1 MFS transporter [Sutterella sp.]
MTNKSPRVVALLIALLAACIAFQLNASMLGPVLITIGRELAADEGAVGFSQTAFFTSAALFSLFLPRLSDMRGRRLVLSVMLAVMTLGTVMAACATSIEMLVAARVIQGVSGPVVPICLLMLRSEIHDNRLYATLMGVVTAVNGGIAGIDAFAGGFIAAHFGFRGVFWTIAVIAAVGTALVAKFAPESKPSAGRRMDWTGVALIVLSLALMLYALNRAADFANFSAAAVFGSVAAGLVAFWLFVKVEKRSAEPLVAVEHLKRRATWSLLLTTTLTMTGVFAVVNGIAMSIAQNPEAGFGLSPDMAALCLLTPYALIGWLFGPFSGRMAPVHGYTFILRLGLLGSIIGVAIVLFAGLSSLAGLVVGIVLLGIAYAGCANILLNGLGVVLSPEEFPGFLPGMNAGAFNLGAGLSFAILPMVQMMFSGADPASTSGYSAAVVTGLVITALALATSFLIPRPVHAED